MPSDKAGQMKNSLIGNFRIPDTSYSHRKPKDLATSFANDSISNQSNYSFSTVAPKDERGQRNSPSIIKSWWKEVLTWLLGTFALLAIILLLVEFDGRPLSQWHSRISINPTVAELSQVAVSAVLFSVSASIG